MDGSLADPLSARLNQAPASQRLAGASVFALAPAAWQEVVTAPRRLGPGRTPSGPSDWRTVESTWVPGASVEPSTTRARCCLPVHAKT